MTIEFLTNQWHYLTQRQKVALPILIILPALRPTPLLFERILVSIVANVFVLEMIKRLPGPPLNQKIRWFVIVLIAVLVVWCRSLPVEIHDDVFNAKDGNYNTYILPYGAEDQSFSPLSVPYTMSRERSNGSVQFELAKLGR